MRKIKVGIIGCGAICHIYIKTLSNAEYVEIVACSDLELKRAEEVSRLYNIKKVLTVEEFFLEKDIELVVNLTIPSAHAEIHLKALQAGKHTYGEKPLATNLEEANKILSIAKEKNLLVGCAPDTFLGGGLQTCKKIIEEGKIGIPIGATAFMMSHGPESFHPRPEFLYQKGAGPLMDMGPYYITALVQLIGPVKAVTSSSSMSFSERTITTKENYGKTFKVYTPTHVASILEFHNGATGTLITSFDVWDTKTPKIEIYGMEGTLIVPDPNRFGGEIYLKRWDDPEFSLIPIESGYVENTKGLGVIDMAMSICTNNEKHEASGKLAYHVLEVMEKTLEAAEKREHQTIHSLI